MNPLLPLLALVAAILGILVVFGCALLAPALRFARGGERDSDDGGFDSLVFGRPAAPRLGLGLPPARPDAERPTVAPPPRRAAAPAYVPRIAAAPPPVPPRPSPPPALPEEIELRGHPVDRELRGLPVDPWGAGSRSRRAAVADVLLVTSDAELSRSQLGVLAAGGYSSRCASCASDALSAVRSRVPDLLLVDAIGPVEAKRVVTAIRSGPGAERVPVVLLTGHDGARAMRRRVAELGVTDVVTDPATMPREVQRALPYWLAGVSVFTTGHR